MLTLLTARDLTLDAAQAARSSRSSTKIPPAAQIKKLLDSRNDREVLDGLRKVTSVCVQDPQRVEERVDESQASQCLTMGTGD